MNKYSQRIAVLSRALLISILAFVPISVSSAEESRLEIPPLATGDPAPGKRVAVTTPEYKETAVHHLIYLPIDWDSDWKTKHRTWPVIVEYSGNLSPPSGSTGEVEGSALGYGLSGGNCIWVVLPYVSEDHTRNQLTWWGDEKATVEYAKRNVPKICATYGGDPRKVVICGFSRGAIAVNYIGLHDDEIAKLWCGFMSHDHYDGDREWQGTKWGFPAEVYRKTAATRLERLAGRPALVCHAAELGGVKPIQDYLGESTKYGAFKFLAVPVKKIFPEIPNSLFLSAHTDRWMFIDSAERRIAREWLAEVLK